MFLCMALVQCCAEQHFPARHTSLDRDRDWLGGPDHAVQSGDPDRYFPFLGAECAGGQPSTGEVLGPSDACLRQ